jgi:hypothetical protein
MFKLLEPPPHQGDQIGRIFAFWVIAHFWYLILNNRSSQNNLATFSHGKSYVLIQILKTGWAAFLGDFFTGASGHPVPCLHVVDKNER